MTLTLPTPRACKANRGPSPVALLQSSEVGSQVMSFAEISQHILATPTPCRVMGTWLGTFSAPFCDSSRQSHNRCSRSITHHAQLTPTANGLRVAAAFFRSFSFWPGVEARLAVTLKWRSIHLLSIWSVHLDAGHLTQKDPLMLFPSQYRSKLQANLGRAIGDTEGSTLDGFRTVHDDILERNSVTKEV